MAIVEMSKLKLIGLDYERENILNALHKTQKVELKNAEQLDDTFVAVDDKKIEDLKNKLDKLNKSIEFIMDCLDKSKKEDFYPKDADGVKNDLLVSYNEFITAPQKEENLDEVVSKCEFSKNRLFDIRSKTVKLRNLEVQLSPYLAIEENFSSFVNTQKTRCFFGTVNESFMNELQTFVSDNELVSLKTYPAGNIHVVFVVAFDEIAEIVSAKLVELGFTKCSFDFDCNAKQKIVEIQNELLEFEKEEREIIKNTCALAYDLRNLKILTDYYSFLKEKAEASEKFLRTEKTFLLEGYLPTEEIENVKQIVSEVSNAVFLDFSEPTEEETPPTLLKNNKVVAQAEFVTNMYSAPDYREFDPNGFVFVFFMIFFGLIMADIGYGLLLMVIGFVLQYRIKVQNGTKKLMSVIMYGGFFTVLFGALFGSFFGFTLYSFLPDPSSGNSQDIMIILLGCMALGLFQITFGYLLKAINEFRHKNIADGLFDGLVWVFFNLGIFCAVFNFLTDYFGIEKAVWLDELFSKLQTPGLIVTLVSLLIAAVSAGRGVKGFGKFTKGFGAVYGIINLLSDILSYARLFGLLLSGMIIAQQFNGMALDIMQAGGVGYVFGGLVMLVGHSFNLAMNVLGAYIHDCRLQYIEFFSKFYTGEGELFTPLGSQFNYIYLTK